MIANKPFATFLDAYSRLPPLERDLAGDDVICPPESNSLYQSTPANALIFSQMGVDGVHDAILKIDGIVREDSPVVQVSPMDSNDVIVIAPTFLDYLADGCEVTRAEMLRVLAAEDAGKVALVAFLNARFSSLRLLEQKRLAALKSKYAHLIERKPRMH